MMAAGMLLSSVSFGQDRTLDRRAVLDTVDSIATVVSNEYFDASVGQRAAAHLREFADAASLAEQTPAALASIMTRELYAVTADKHLFVAAAHRPATQSAPAPAEARARRAAFENFGFRDVAILEGNIGYLDVRTFYRIDEARATLDAAMRFLVHADALVIDLRNNQGGSPETVAHLVAYLFDRPGKPLFDIVPRSGPAVHYSTPSPAVEGANGKRPVFVLTSARTFSAGEGLAFILQEERRAVVVGERTPGAANPGRPYPAGPDFEVTVPNGQVRTAASGGNWEGVGVNPDVVTPAERAQAAAVELAKGALPSNVQAPR
jgi:hypothetical protein